MSVASRSSLVPCSAKNNRSSASDSSRGGADGSPSQARSALRPLAVMAYSVRGRRPFTVVVALTSPCSSRFFGSWYSRVSARGQQKWRLRRTCFVSS